MGDYILERLNSRDFEHLTQSLALKEIGAGITPFGDGPDGGREATYTGKMAHPSTQSPWDGYFVIQCKFLQRPSGDRGRDENWALDQLQVDLEKFYGGERELSKPDYYIFVTNVTLTAVQDAGSKDRAFALLREYQNSGCLKGFDI